MGPMRARAIEREHLEDVRSVCLEIGCSGCAQCARLLKWCMGLDGEAYVFFGVVPAFCSCVANLGVKGVYDRSASGNAEFVKRGVEIMCSRHCGGAIDSSHCSSQARCGRDVVGREASKGEMAG